tara:strand:- start:59 stop:274 length:216 start_codon:yes stop_codon:yes gene_type:complete
MDNLESSITDLISSSIPLQFQLPIIKVGGAKSFNCGNLCIGLIVILLVFLLIKMNKKQVTKVEEAEVKNEE